MTNIRLSCHERADMILAELNLLAKEDILLAMGTLQAAKIKLDSIYLKTVECESITEEGIRSMSLSMSKLHIEGLDLSVRTINSLLRGNITTVGELVSHNERELLVLRNFGPLSLRETKEKLRSLGLSLAAVIDADEETKEDSDACNKCTGSVQG
jgi:DNA-directed RNA polymerase alpha subunit